MCLIFVFKQKTAYEMRISDWSSDVCSSDLIPWLRLNQQSLVQFGHGKYQQRIQATVTGRTPHIAVELAGDKEETNKILASLGLPVPRQVLVTSQTDARKDRKSTRLNSSH